MTHPSRLAPLVVASLGLAACGTDPADPGTDAGDPGADAAADAADAGGPPRPAPRAWTVENVDLLSQPAVAAAAAIDGTSVNLHIARVGAQLGVAYYKIPEMETRVAFETATGWDLETIDAAGIGGAFLGEGPGGIALSYETGYESAEPYNVRLASFTGATWSTEAVSTLAEADNYYNNPTTLWFDAAGQPVIVGVKGEGSQNPAIFRWNGASWDLEVVATPHSGHRNLAAAFDGAGRPHLVYSAGRYDATAGQWFNRPYHAYFDGVDWLFEPLADEEPAVSGFGFNGFSVAVDSTGQVHAVFGLESSPTPSDWSQTWSYGVRSVGGTWSIEPLADAQAAAMIVDAADTVDLAVGTALGIEYRRKNASGGWLIESVLRDVQVDGNNRGLGLAIDPAGVPAIAYVDVQTGELNVVRPPPPGAPVPAAWSCTPTYHDDGHCDCGCEDVDPDCGAGGCTDPGCTDHTATTAGVCEYCWGGAPVDGVHGWCDVEE